jgi:parallel beta-helix repeat protein
LDDVVADIYKAITVQSTGGASITFIQKTPHPMGWGDGAVRLRDANGITFDGFTVRNSATANEGAGILIGAPFAGSNDHRSNNNTVKNCVVDNASIGIYLYETSGNTIQNNEVFGMRDQPAGSFGVGIILWDDEPTGTSHNTNNAITGNNVHDCDRFGFALGGWGAPSDRFEVAGTSITNNIFTNNYCTPDCQSLGFMFATGLLTLSGNVITPSTEKEFFFSNTEILDSVKVNGDYFWTPDWLNPFSIQEAIYTVIPGGTVVVEAGTYVEDITIGKSLTLIGAGTGKGLTLVKPGTDQAYVPPPTNSGITVMTVTANNVTIKDLEVDGTMIAGDPGLRTNMAKRGIYGSSVDNLRVEGCEVIRCVSGIVGVLSTNLNFHGNTLDDCGHSFNVGGGIYLWGSSGDVGILGKPNVLTNIVDCGIMYHASSSGNAKYNQMTNCELGMLVNGNNNPTIFDHNNIEGTSIDGGIQVVHPGADVTISNDSVLCDYDALLVFNSGTNTVTVTDNHFYYTSTKGSEDQRHYRIPWMGEEYSGAYTLLNDKSGESGIYLSTESTYGDGPVYATITGNIVAGYDYDVRCHERSGDPSQLMDVDANGGASINFFYDYGTYAWYMDNCNDDINATYNYWGKSLVSQIEQGIYHQVDNSTLGLVDFSNPYLLGDVNTDRVINVIDVVYLINYIFINGPPPSLLILGDTNRDGQIDVEDVITLINYLFLSGPPPIVSEEK